MGTDVLQQRPAIVTGAGVSDGDGDEPPLAMGAGAGSCLVPADMDVARMEGKVQRLELEVQQWRERAKNFGGVNERLQVQRQVLWRRLHPRLESSGDGVRGGKESLLRAWLRPRKRPRLEANEDNVWQQQQQQLREFEDEWQQAEGLLFPLEARCAVLEAECERLQAENRELEHMLQVEHQELQCCQVGACCNGGSWGCCSPVLSLPL